jgi:gamma-glutamyl:cysteine ligase YbdK (ATP-grasp superfamily)
MLLLRKGARRCLSPFRLERRCSGDPNSCLIYAPVRPELLHAADWRASRHGLDAELVDAEVARVISAREMIEKVLPSHARRSKRTGTGRRSPCSCAKS